MSTILHQNFLPLNAFPHTSPILFFLFLYLFSIFLFPSCPYLLPHCILPYSTLYPSYHSCFSFLVIVRQGGGIFYSLTQFFFVFFHSVFRLLSQMFSSFSFFVFLSDFVVSFYLHFFLDFSLLFSFLFPFFFAFFLHSLQLMFFFISVSFFFF